MSAVRRRDLFFADDRFFDKSARTLNRWRKVCKSVSMPGAILPRLVAGSVRLVFAVNRSWGKIIGGIPRVPRAQGSGPKSCERSGIRAILFPFRVCGIACNISCTPPMTRAQRTKPLKILKSPTFLTGYGVVVEFKYRHPAKQKVGCCRPSARYLTELL